MGTGGGAGLSPGIAVGLLVLIVLVALGYLGTQLRGRNEATKSFATPLVAHPRPFKRQLQWLRIRKQHPLLRIIPAHPVCWTCRQPITTAAVGCPSCGARYHADGTGGCNANTIAECVNCQADSSTFVRA